jgi:hypothetical protein
MKGQEVLNFMRGTDKHSESSIELAAHTQFLKQQKHKWQESPHMYISIITLNANGLNSPIKRHHLANWIKKEDQKICFLQDTHLIDRNKHWIRVKGWRAIYQATAPQNRQE